MPRYQSVPKPAPVSFGGTGTNSLNIYELLAGASAAPVVGLPNGTAGLPLLSGGAGAYPSFLADWVTANIAQTTLGTTTTLTGASGTQQQITGLSVPLALTGTWFVFALIRTALAASTAGAYINAQLRNDTAASTIGQVFMLNQANGPSSQFSQLTGLVWGLVRVTVPSTITPWVARNGTGFAASSLPVDSGGTSTTFAIQLSNQ